MNNPAIAKVISRNNTLLADLSAQRLADDAMVAAERALNLLNPDADDTIVFVWNEVEAHFSNLKPPAVRVEGRKWGIIYNRVGDTKIVTGTVRDSVTLAIIAGVLIYFENGINEAISDAEGKFSLSTTLMDVQKLIATHPLYANYEVTVTLVEGENLTVEILMVKL